MKKITNQKGFTLIEILVVIGIIAILAAVVLIAINPARQFAQGRNSQRTSNVNAIVNSVGQYQADNKGLLTCWTTAGLDGTFKKIAKTGGVNARSCVVSNYMSEISSDPSIGSNSCVDTVPGDCASGTYDTGYEIKQDTTTKRITVRAPGAELGQTIEITR